LLLAGDLSLSHMITPPLVAAALTTITTECEMALRVPHQGDPSVLFHRKFVPAVRFKQMNKIIQVIF
jgi:hypothetical protein